MQADKTIECISMCVCSFLEHKAGSLIKLCTVQFPAICCPLHLTCAHTMSWHVNKATSDSLCVCECSSHAFFELRAGSLTSFCTVCFSNISCAVHCMRRHMSMHKRGRSLTACVYVSVCVCAVHMISLSTELDYSPGSAQYGFLVSDLQKVNRTLTPWLVANFHRPYVSADVSLSEACMCNECVMLL